MKSLKKNSLKLKIILIFATLVIIAMLIVWLVQTLLLDNAYNSVKAGMLSDQAEVVAENLESEDVQALVERIAYSNGISVAVIQPDGTTLYSANSPYSPLANLGTSSLKEYYLKAQQKGGSFLQSSSKIIDSSGYSPENYVGDVPKSISETKEQYILYSLIATTSNGNEYAVITCAVFSNASNNMTFASLISALVISVLFLLLGIVCIVVISRQVIKPIEQITASAELLAKGETDVTFDAHGFREVNELSDVLNHTASELAKVDNLRKELIANVSHDLRTPLSLIKGYSELMRDVPEERSEENLQVVIDESTRLGNLVNDMLNLSRLQQKNINPNLAEFDIAEVVQDVYTRVSKMLTAEDCHVEFKSTLKTAIVNADKDMMMQVIYNLLSNAINYVGDDKKILVNLRRRGDNVRVEVIDHGIGIDVDDIPHIWDRYYKSDRNHKRASVGTGLGLSIVKSVMDSHPGGTCGVTTTKGFGSNFYVELPIISCESL